MLADKDFLDKILNYIGEKLNHEAEALLIDGNAMVFYSLRGQTKDVDLVLYTKEDMSAVVRILTNHPLYKDSKLTKRVPYAYRKELGKQLPTIIEKKDLPRFDLFYKNVFSVPTAGALKRAKTALRYGLLVLRLIEPEDLIVMKAVTERPQDREDINRLIASLRIDWEKVLAILKEYYALDKKIAFFAASTLHDLEAVPKDVAEKAVGLLGLKL